MNTHPKNNIVSKEHYDEVHYWLKKQYGKADECEISKNHHKPFHWANISGCYLHNKKDWRKLCIQCHVALDRLGFTITKLKEKEEYKQQFLKGFVKGGE